jgi:hypothetical protein
MTDAAPRCACVWSEEGSYEEQLETMKPCMWHDNWRKLDSFVELPSKRPPITHVAVRFNEQVWSLPKPFRHQNIIRTIADLTGETSIDCNEDRGDQGFLDATGRYLTRKQALVSALLNKQVKDENDIRCGMLFSEDVW